MSAKLKTAVLGATGYSGLELTRLLHRHPKLERPVLPQPEQRPEQPEQQPPERPVLLPSQERPERPSPGQPGFVLLPEPESSRPRSPARAQLLQSHRRRATSPRPLPNHQPV